MARKTETDIALVTDHGWLTLKQAAKLTNTPLDRLRRMIRTGDLHAFTVERNGTTKFRVSRAALVDAGLLKAGGTQESATSFDLLALIRDQNQR
ncbi:MAG TPA: helix-turn-helix domain-containing protein, partial [Thermomicrobiales bacterium]|nr:helix-turn-helix domain-containing protein [Thermomicrobiales bacterium]